MTSFAKNFICKKAKLFLFAVLVCSLSERVRGETEAQRAFCSECFKEGKTAIEIKALKRKACEQMLKRPECVNVPEMLQADCNNFNPRSSPMSASFDEYWSFTPVTLGCLTSTGLVGVPLAAVGAALAKVVGASAVGGKLSVLGKFKRPVVGLAVVTGAAGLYVSYKYYKEWNKSRSLASEEGWNREQRRQYVKGMTLAGLSEKMYNLMFNDLHCYNEFGAAARVCGTISVVISAGTIPTNTLTGAVLSGVAVGGTALYIGNRPGAQHFDKEFRKVQREVKRKMREADPLLSSPDTL